MCNFSQIPYDVLQFLICFNSNGRIGNMRSNLDFFSFYDLNILRLHRFSTHILEYSEQQNVPVYLFYALIFLNSFPCSTSEQKTVFLQVKRKWSVIKWLIYKFISIYRNSTKLFQFLKKLPSNICSLNKIFEKLLDDRT